MTVAPKHLEADIVPLLRPFAGVYRRKSRRFLFPVQSPGTLYVPNGNDVRHVWMHDISEHGVGFCSLASVKVGTQIVLILKNPPHPPLCLRGTVAHSTEIGPKDWRIGCAFAVPLTTEMLEGML